MAQLLIYLNTPPKETICQALSQAIQNWGKNRKLSSSASHLDRDMLIRNKEFMDYKAKEEVNRIRMKLRNKSNRLLARMIWLKWLWMAHRVNKTIHILGFLEQILKQKTCLKFRKVGQWAWTKQTLQIKSRKLQLIVSKEIHHHRRLCSISGKWNSTCKDNKHLTRNKSFHHDSSFTNAWIKRAMIDKFYSMKLEWYKTKEIIRNWDSVVVQIPFAKVTLLVHRHLGNR